MKAFWLGMALSQLIVHLADLAGWYSNDWSAIGFSVFGVTLFSCLLLNEHFTVERKRP